MNRAPFLGVLGYRLQTAPRTLLCVPDVAVPLGGPGPLAAVKGTGRRETRGNAHYVPRRPRETRIMSPDALPDALMSPDALV